MDINHITCHECNTDLCLIRELKVEYSPKKMMLTTDFKKLYIDIYINIRNTSTDSVTMQL